jgi:hypothetical protein
MPVFYVTQGHGQTFGAMPSSCCRQKEEQNVCRYCGLVGLAGGKQKSGGIASPMARFATLLFD